MYASYIYQDAEVRPYLGPLAAHSWGVLDLQDGEITRFADFALEYGLHVWMTEMGCFSVQPSRGIPYVAQRCEAGGDLQPRAPAQSS